MENKYEISYVKNNVPQANIYIAESEELAGEATIQELKKIELEALMVAQKNEHCQTRSAGYRGSSVAFKDKLFMGRRRS